jgi:hypothetical protein
MYTNYSKLEGRWLNKNDSCFINVETHNQKRNPKALQQVYPPNLILAISKYNSHN